MKFSIVNLGCKVNRVESDDVAAMLLARGATCSDLPDADVVIVNTCTVTGEAEKKTRKAVRHALRANTCAKVVVTGCAVAIDPETYDVMSDRVVTVSKGDLMSAVEREFESARELRLGEGFPTRVGIKVQDGCNNACTYCIVHVARGRAWSRPLEQIVDEAVAYDRAGVREMVLTGINLGSYSVEIANGARGGLAYLLKSLLSSVENARFRISSIEPKDIDDDLIDILSSSGGRVCRHLHLPLQSGSSKVLKEMARPYDAAYYLGLVTRLRRAVPSLALSTDIIVGFPGETEEDFQATLDMVRACRFSKVHAFRYSMREGTPAASRPDQIPPEVKAARLKELERVAEEARCDDLMLRYGEEEQALVETEGVATTESYYSVEAPSGSVPGELVSVSLCGARALYD